MFRGNDGMSSQMSSDSRKVPIPIYLDILVEITLNFIRAEYSHKENIEGRPSAI